jgi:serine/threonine-protein kinase
MAPEQARSQTLDRRCDVWAAGVIAWELLSERRLYATDNDVGTLLKVVSEEPAPLRTVVPDLSPAIEAAVKHALTIDLSRRVPSAQAFARELGAACQAAGLLADHEQVAAHLATLVGTRLRERRRRAAEIVRLRSKLGRVVEASSSDAQTKSVEDGVAEARGPLNVIPEPEASSSDVVLSPAALESATPVPTRNDSVGTVAASVTDAKVTDDASALEPMAAGLPRYQPKRLVALVAGALVVLGGISAAIFGGNRTGRTANASTSSSAVAAPAPLPSAVSVVPPDIIDLPATPAIASKLVLHANAPLAVVHVDDRVASPSKPAKETTIELTGAEHGRTLKLFAATTDGRQATTLVPAGATSASLEFKDVKDTSPAPGPRPPKPPTSQKPPTLAPSPYATKP